MAERLLSAPPSIWVVSAKAVLRSVPRPWARPTAGSTAGPEPLRVPDVVADPQRLAAYRRVCGFDVGSEPGSLPATYPHVLAFPLHLQLMTEPRFPFAPLGAVHIADTIIQHRPIRTGEELQIVVSVGEVTAHTRGRQVSVHTEVAAGAEEVWREESVFLSRSRSPAPAQAPLSPVPPSGAAAAAPPAADEPAGVSSTSLVWELPGNLGRRYARVSGDLNPIHLFDLTARPFGFRSRLAHGMWTAARALAELTATGAPPQFRLSVQFRKPVYLPGRVVLTTRRGVEDDSSVDFLVRSSSASAVEHLTGRLERRR